MAWDHAEDETKGLISPGSMFVSATDPRPCSVSLWLKLADNSLCSPFTSDASGGPNVGCFINASSTDIVMRAFNRTTYATDSSVIALADFQNLWCHFGWTIGAGSPGTTTYYFNGAANGTASVTWEADADAGSPRIGMIGTGFVSWELNGYSAEFGFWDVALSAADMAALGAGFSPEMVRPESCLSYVAGRDPAAVDTFSADSPWALNGSILRVSDHPPMIYPSSLFVPSVETPVVLGRQYSGMSAINRMG